MSNITTLIQFIKDKGRVSYDGVKIKAEEIDPLWHEQTWVCGLRHSKEVDAEGRNPLIDPNGHNPIAFYKTVGFEVVEAIDKIETETLDENLRKVIKDFPNPWDSRDAIIELNEAIKNKDVWKKKFVLRRYK